MGDHQGHNAHKSCRACHAGRDVLPTKKFVAANGEKIDDLGEKTIPFKSDEGVHLCIKFRSANVVKTLISMRKVVQAGNFVVLDEKHPHIRNNRDGTIIKLYVNNGVVHHGHVGVSR